MTDDISADPPGPRRITRTLVAVLHAMRDAGDAHVAQIAAAAGVRPTTALALMHRMEGWGAVTGRWDARPAKRPVRLYRLTPAGLTLAAHLDDREAAPC